MRYFSVNSDIDHLLGSVYKINHLWAYLMLGQILPISFTQNLFSIALILHPLEDPKQSVDMPDEHVQDFIIVAYGLLLHVLGDYVGEAVPLSIILATRFFLLVPVLTYRVPISFVSHVRVAADRLGAAHGSSDTILLLWALYFSGGRWPSWDDANGNPAIRTLAYDLLLSVISGAWI